MIADRIKQLRENMGLSQAQLAKTIGVSRSAVNAWEMGLSMPTIQFVVSMSKLFHVTSDYILGLDDSYTVKIDNYSPEELSLIYGLIKYIDKNKESI